MCPFASFEGGDVPVNDDEMLRILVESVPGVVFLCRNDEAFSLLYISDAAESITTYAAADYLAGRIAPLDVIHPDDLPTIRAVITKALTQRGSFHNVYRQMLEDGSWRWMEAYGQGVFDDAGKAQYLGGMILDISDRKAAEDALRSAHDEMEQRVRDRTAELADANAVLRKEQETLRQLLDKQEREQRILACEIHDGLVQYAIGAQMQLEVAALRAGSDPKAAQAALDQARLLIQNSIEEGRRLIGGLRPPILDERGIVAAIDYLLHEYQWPRDVQIQYEADESLTDMAPDLATALFRIAQEALTNARRHSGAKRIRVELARDKGDIRLEIRDWGVGFKQDEQHTASFGLRGIQERVKLHGGSLRIDSEPGRGTLIAVRFPVTGDAATA